MAAEDWIRTVHCQEVNEHDAFETVRPLNADHAGGDEVKVSAARLSQCEGQLGLHAIFLVRSSARNN